MLTLARLAVAVEVAQVHVVSQLPLQNLDVHFSICQILGFIILHSCHRQFFGGTPGNSSGLWGVQFVDLYRTQNECIVGSDNCGGRA